MLLHSILSTLQKVLGVVERENSGGARTYSTTKTDNNLASFKSHQVYLKANSTYLFLLTGSQQL